MQWGYYAYNPNIIPEIYFAPSFLTSTEVTCDDTDPNSGSVNPLPAEVLHWETEDNPKQWN